MLKTTLRGFVTGVFMAGIAGLTGCGGGGGATGPTVPSTAPVAAEIKLKSSVSSITPDGSTTTKITATAVDANGVPVSGVTIKFSAAAGQLGASSGLSSSPDGLVTVEYSALPTSGMPDPKDRTETVTASVVGTSVTAQISIKVGAPSTTLVSSVASIILSSSVASIKPDGSTTSTITATAVDAYNLPVSGVTIKFSATSGQFGASSGVSSTPGGLVTATYSALSPSGTVNSAERTETITASVVGTSVTAQIPIKVTSTTPGPAASVVILSSSAASIKPDGSTTTTITATVVDANNLPVSGATVKFTASGGQLGASSGVSSLAGAGTPGGVVTVTYSALSPSGTTNPADRTETITATVVGTSVTAQIPVKVTSTTSGPAASAVVLGSSTASIKPDGSTTATITATVVDANSLPVSGATVKFAATGGQLGASSGPSSATGTVSITYSAVAAGGTINPADRTETITATVVGTNVNAQIPIKVTSASAVPVSAAAVKLASSAASVKADGSTTTTITATVVDANNLPVSGATVRFSATGGQLGVSSGVTGANGSVTISYSAIGAFGNYNPTDRTETVTASVVGTLVSDQISIKVTASLLSLALSSSVSSIKTDGSNSTTITATIVDSSNLAVAGQSVKFKASQSTGKFGVSSGVSSAAGVVQIPYSAIGSTETSDDRTNRTETITGNIVGTSVEASIPIKIEGSTLTLNADATTTQVGSSVKLQAIAKDAASSGVNAQRIQFSVDNRLLAAGKIPGGAIFGSGNSFYTGQQDLQGKTPPQGATQEVQLTGTNAGDVAVKAEWVNSKGQTTLTTSTTISINPAGVSFEVTSPTTNPTPLPLAASTTIKVSVPTLISGKAVANVRFATTLGTWSNSTKSSTVVPVGNAVTETLAAGVNAGNANIQIDARDSSGTVLATLNRVFALSSATGTQINLQPAQSTVAPSTGGTTNTTTLTATVRDARNNAVGNVPVLFEIVNPTGSGEQISPVIAYTNDGSDPTRPLGQATSVFSSGALSTVGGLQIRATLVGTAVSDTKTINVAGSSVSVTVGQANAINSTDTSTTYTLPMSVLVVSSTGAAVSGATVTLSAFPTSYYRGSRDVVCNPVYSSAGVTVPGIVTAGVTTAFPNEDVNENDILEAGEDYDPKGDGRGLGTITPPHAAAGTLPPTVVTNASGVGTFNLIYLKNYAQWIQARVRAKVVVNGSEFANDLKFDLPALSVDMIPVCTLPNSPFGA